MDTCFMAALVWGYGMLFFLIAVVIKRCIERIQEVLNG